MDMKRLIKETVKEMILDGDIDLELVDVRDYIYPPKYELRIVVKNDEGKSEYNVWSGIEVGGNYSKRLNEKLIFYK